MDDIELLKSAFSATPGNHDLAQLLFLKLRDADRWSDVLELRDMAAGHAATWWWQGVVGEALLKSGRPDEARPLLIRALADTERDGADEDDLKRYFRLAILSGLACRETSAADAELSRMLEHFPDEDVSDLLAVFAAAGHTPKWRQKARQTEDLSNLTDFRPAPPERERIDFSQVGGMEELKEAARMNIILPFSQPELFKRYGRKAGGGLLLYGPPGCGKTWFARAIAGECGAAFFNVGIHDILNLYVGNSERNIHRLFEAARGHAPALLFIDEIDALGRKRDLMRHSAVTSTINAFLAEMDGAGGDNENLLVIGATNAPWDLDPAFKRPGRFDRMFFVPPPDAAAREEILRLHFAGKPCDGIDFGRLAVDSECFSGADLAALAGQAAERVLAEVLKGGPERPISWSDAVAVLKKMKPTTREWLSMARSYVEYANEDGGYDAVKEYLERSGPRRRMGFF